LPASSVDLITRAARTGDWSNVVAAQNELASQLISFSPPAVDRNYRIKEFVRKISRNLHPTGLMVVCLGPDGAGKSTALSAMKEGLEKAFRRTAQFHLRPKMLKGTAAASQFVADPHGKPNRGILTSILKVIYFCLDYWVSYFARLRPMLVRSTFVLFDRYFYDLQVDQRRYRYSGPTWLVRMLSHLVPAPDLVLVFDAPADQIHARKQELPLEELSRQRELYRHFAASRRRCPVRMIDASKPIDEMISQCFTEVLTVLEARTHKRLNLDR
jgi:thymidylate kinase